MRRDQRRGREGRTGEEEGGEYERECKVNKVKKVR